MQAYITAEQIPFFDRRMLGIMAMKVYCILHGKFYAAFMAMLNNP